MYKKLLAKEKVQRLEDKILRCMIQQITVEQALLNLIVIQQLPFSSGHLDTSAEHVETASGETTQPAAPYRMKIRMMESRKTTVDHLLSLQHHQLLLSASLVVRCRRATGFLIQQTGPLRVQLQTMPLCWLKAVRSPPRSLAVQGLRPI